MFVHCVYLWLKEDLTPKQLEDVKAGISSLTSLASVKHGYFGTPADTNRPVIDRTYSYGLVVMFESAADHDAYQVDPAHDDFRKNFASYWKSVKIYDFE